MRQKFHASGSFDTSKLMLNGLQFTMYQYNSALEKSLKTAAFSWIVSNIFSIISNLFTVNPSKYIPGCYIWYSMDVVLFSIQDTPAGGHYTMPLGKKLDFNQAYLITWHHLTVVRGSANRRQHSTFTKPNCFALWTRYKQKNYCIFLIQFHVNHCKVAIGFISHQPPLNI